MGLDDSEAGTAHSFAYSFCKVAKTCSNPSAQAISWLTEALMKPIFFCQQSLAILPVMITITATVTMIATAINDAFKPIKLVTCIVQLVVHVFNMHVNTTFSTAMQIKSTSAKDLLQI